VSLIKTPLGDLELVTSSRGIRRLEFIYDQAAHQVIEDEETTDDASLAAETQRQLDGYFAGTLLEFELPLDPQGTEFQRRAWDVIANVPFGETISYGTVALLAGAPGAARAAGSACGHNPIVLLVPCHRVVASGGGIGGYGAGMHRKVWLLEHEGSLAPSKTRVIQPPLLPV
jgi:methylated-DNA-[protein]-cysteine S-methyltransferase